MTPRVEGLYNKPIHKFAIQLFKIPLSSSRVYILNCASVYYLPRAHARIMEKKTLQRNEVQRSNWNKMKKKKEKRKFKTIGKTK